ncbi:MAG TPA: outer membrane beta-barrel protein [Fimbriimonadaceae bacterium]|nr:outer membrane beta-barrel protein [Fimbriimonadaceae bacterium]
MNTHTLAALGLAALSSSPGWAQTSPSAKTWNVDISGYADLYYQYDFGRPAHSGGVNGRWFDINHDEYTLAALQLDLSRAPTAQNPLGFLVSLYAGKNADIVASTEPGGIDTYKNFLQAYASYLVPGKISTTIDFGKWTSFIGYEGFDSRSQDNYSRSFVFTGLEPGYMTGLRTTTVLDPRWTANLYAFQGCNEVQDSNHGKTFGAGVTRSFGSGSVTLTGYYGDEGSDTQNDSGSYGGIGFPTPGVSKVAQASLYGSWQVNAKDKLAFDAEYASAKGKGNWSGAEIIYRRQIDKRNAAAFRLDHAEDPDGLRFFAGSLGLNSLTGTYDLTLSTNVLFRLELRHDLASNDYFDSASGPKRQRTTITFAQIVKF